MKTTTLAPLLLASTAAAVAADIASFSLACNPAHSYPDGLTCVETGGTLTLEVPTATESCNLLDVGASCYATATPTTPTTTITPITPTTPTTPTAPLSTAPSYPSSTTSSTLTVVTSPASASSSTSSVRAPAYSYSTSNASSVSASGSSTLTLLTTITQTSGNHTHTKASHHTGMPSLMTDTTTPPIPSASSPSATSPASTSPSPASGDASAIRLGGFTALVVFAGLLVL